ncbi:MAG TPA: endonuclease/exonuclease/phosphatase family protein [Acidimicrobiales bacterium]|nr:endonuclease/exonuclease/phosphatase family protein [Acidimicrobiales bacterium]
MLHGRSLGDGRVSTERLVAACASLTADVLALQEVDRNQARSGHVDQTAAVAGGMDAAAWRFEPALVGEPGATWRAATEEDDPASTEAGYGVGLVSRLPVRAWYVVRLQAAKVRAPVAVPGGRGRFILLPDEPRVAVAAEIETVNGPLLVATTHLSFVPGWNLVQLRTVTGALAALGPPCVLLGDLNVPGPLPALATGWRALAKAKTFPGPNPSMQIDHALGHGLLPVVAGADAPELPLSDHRALVVDFL